MQPRISARRLVGLIEAFGGGLGGGGGSLNAHYFAQFCIKFTALRHLCPCCMPCTDSGPDRVIARIGGSLHCRIAVDGGGCRIKDQLTQEAGDAPRSRSVRGQHQANVVRDCRQVERLRGRLRRAGLGVVGPDQDRAVGPRRLIVGALRIDRGLPARLVNGER